MLYLTQRLWFGHNNFGICACKHSRHLVLFSDKVLLHLQILIARYGVTRNVEANQRDLINTVIPNQHASEVALLLVCYEKLTAKPGPLVAVVVQVHPQAAGRLGH